MFCRFCGRKIRENSRYCDSCGNSTTTENQSLNDPFEFPGESLTTKNTFISGRKKLSESKKFRMSLLLSFISISIATAGLLFFPRPHPISINVAPIGDFAFDSNCKPSNEGTLPQDAVRFTAFDSAGRQVHSSVVDGAWVKKEDLCEFSSNVWLPASASSFTVSVTAEDSVFESPKSREIPWTISTSMDVGKTYKISGNLLILNSLDSYDMSECRTSLALSGGECGSVYWQFYSRKCQGSGGFSDIGLGTPVNVVDDKGLVVATGALSQGLLDYDVMIQELKEKKQLNCPISFEVNRVPGLSGSYLLEVGNRGERRYTFDELKEMNWRVGYQIGR